MAALNCSARFTAAEDGRMLKGFNYYKEIFPGKVQQRVYSKNTKTSIEIKIAELRCCGFLMWQGSILLTHQSGSGWFLWANENHVLTAVYFQQFTVLSVNSFLSHCLLHNMSANTNYEPCFALLSFGSTDQQVSLIVTMETWVLVLS